MSRLAFLALLGALSIGCGGAVYNAGQRATQAAVDTLDSPKYKKELDDMAAEAAGAARDRALDADTAAKLVAIRDAMLDEKLHVEIAGLREELLGAETRRLSLQLVDGALADVDAQIAHWRETAFGQPLRDDFDALAADASGKLPGLAQATMAPVQVTVASDASRVEHVAMWALAVLVAVLLTVQVVTHRKLVAAIGPRG